MICVLFVFSIFLYIFLNFRLAGVTALGFRVSQQYVTFKKFKTTRLASYESANSFI